jgi:hypothetical protein
LIQDADDLWNGSPVAVLERYRAFIRDPIEIMVFPTGELAKENGYSLYKNYGMRREISYNIIVFDAPGRQIWLDADIDKEKPVLKQTSIDSILGYCGFETDKKILKNESADESLFQKIMSWLGTNVRSLPVEPIHLKKT